LELFLFALIAGKDIQEFPVKKPSNIVDTNGAGDSFVGGMFYIDVE
jgi:sugar/nucleoside kinase (ribokinase family)